MGIVTGIRSALRGRPVYRDFHGADPDAALIKDALQRRDLAPIVELIRQQRGGAWGDRHFLCEVVARQAPADLLDALCRSDSRNAIAHLLRGAKGIFEAWEDRGPEDTLTSQKWTAFQRRLQASQKQLERAATLDPVDPTPHVYMLTIGRGLHQPAGGACEHFDRAVARDPLHFQAHAEMLSLLCAKWGGSHESMFEFARAAAAAAPEGNELRLIVMLAHIERWHYSYAMEGDEPAAAAWVAAPAVQQETIAAYSSSLFSDFHVPGRYTPQRRNEAAFWFHLGGDRDRLRREMHALGRVWTETPWDYLGDPRTVFEQARKTAM